MKRIMSVLIMVVMLLTTLSVCADFNDTKVHWASNDINFMVSKGIVNGKGDNTFKPDDYITRAEFIAMIARLLNLKSDHYDGELNDVVLSDWHANAIQAVINANLIDRNLMKEKWIYPNQNITRQEMASIVTLAYEYMGNMISTEPKLDKFVDKDNICECAREYVNKAINAGLMKGTTETTFDPTLTATRAQSVVILRRLLNNKESITSNNSSGTLVTKTEEASLTKEEIGVRFPLYQAGILNQMGGYLTGFSLVAKYDNESPNEVYVKYLALGTQNSTMPFKAYKHIVVYDTEGKTIAYYDFSDCEVGETKEIIIKLPKMKAGIYHVVASGGNTGDRVEIGMPKTDIWGISGNMKLAVTETTPKTGYVYLPKTTEEFSVLTFGAGGTTAEFDIYDSKGKLVGRPVYEPTRKRGELFTKEGVKDCVWSIVHQGKMPSSIIINGSPGLLTQTKEAALALKGGTFEANGITVSGALQVRARNAMVEIAKEGFDVNIDWPSEVPKDLENIQLESLIFGAYGGLSTIKYAFETQIIDPESPYYGCFMYKEFENIPDKTWENYVYKNRYNINETASLASLYTYPAKLNLTYKNKGILNRAIISALALITQLNSENIIRQIDLKTNEYPLMDFFFQYPSIAEGYYLLKDELPPEISEIWRDGLFAIGDTLGNFISFQPNQWSNILTGHLNTYMATGEKRFLEKFETMSRSYAQYHIGNKMSQHPAGYFMENLGPDGNYESMNLECLISNYHDYKNLPEANSEIVEIMRSSIERSIEFQKFHWLPQTDGKVVSPNSISSRTLQYLANEGHAAVYAAYPEFPTAAARFALNTMPTDGLGVAKVMSYIANNEQWQRNIIEWGIKSKGDGFDGARRNMYCIWPTWMYKSYSLPTRVEASKLPIDEESGIWELPGQIAFKTGELYTLIFYGGDPASVNSQRSGAPISVWTKKTGNVIMSMKNTNDYTKIDIPNSIHTAIIGEQNGKIFQSGTENGILSWIKKDEIFEIKSTIKDSDVSLRWRYEIHKNGFKLTAWIESATDVQNAYLNLPIYKYESNAVISEPKDGTFSFSLNDATLSIKWPSALKATMGQPVKETGIGKDVQSLKIPFPSYGRPLEINVNYK